MRKALHLKRPQSGHISVKYPNIKNREKIQKRPVRREQLVPKEKNLSVHRDRRSSLCPKGGTQTSPASDDRAAVKSLGPDTEWAGEPREASGGESGTGASGSGGAGPQPEGPRRGQESQVWQEEQRSGPGHGGEVLDRHCSTEVFREEPDEGSDRPA